MNPTQPGKLLWLIVLTVAWALYGLNGRDAWQAEEARAFATVLDSTQGHLVSLATPAPLFTWVATGFSALPMQFGLNHITLLDSSRWASGLFTLITLTALALSARGLLGVGFGPAVALALLGCLGFMLPAHAFIPETALLAMWALLFWGMGLARSAPKTSGIVLALSLTGLTLGLRGLPDLLAGLLLICLPLAWADWRSRTYWQSLAFGLTLTAAFITLGMAYAASTGHLSLWWQTHVITALHPKTGGIGAFSDLAWLAWPLWPLALTALWHDHRRLSRTPALHLPLAALIILLLLAPFPAWSRLGGLLPVLLPLALLSAYAMAHLRRGSAQAFYWFGVVCFAFFIVLFWIYFAAIELGLPTRLATHVAKLTPGYIRGSVASTSVWLAALATGLWLIAVPLFPRAQTRPILVWASGMTLVWVLIMALFRPWAEAGWGYRPTIMEIERHLPRDACLTLQVDPGMAAMLRYHLPRQTSLTSGRDCAWRLIGHPQTAAAHTAATPWEVVWEGARPRYKKQRYRLEHLRATP